jgi:hypothetical protein
MRRSSKILLIMVACALVALGFGFYVMKSRTSSLSNTQASTSDQSQKQEQQKQTETVPADTTTPPASTVGWKTYTNDKHGFNLQYPAALKAGSISDNSVLGTAQVPVRGYHVGSLVFVVLKDASIKKDAQDLFKGVYDAAKTPAPAGAVEGDVPPIQCKILVDTADKKAVSCSGEGGPAKYAYITGPAYDVFVDGYSRGYDNQENGNLKSDADFVGVLNTFAFGSAPVTDNTIKTTTTTTTTATTTSPTSASPNPVTPASFQAFTITADDNGASPDQIMVAKDAIVQITFNVSATNVYYGGLDFRSAIVNSGTIHSGESKTISFKATESFQFTPYWPASSVAKGYKITVTVQ